MAKVLELNGIPVNKKNATKRRIMREYRIKPIPNHYQDAERMEPEKGAPISYIVGTVMVIAALFILIVLG